MKYFWNLFFLISIFFLCVSYSFAQDDTPQNINKLLNNQAVVSRQIICILDKGPCDNIGKQLKAALPEVISKNCANCTRQQAQNAQRLISFLQARYPEVWSLLYRKYKQQQA
ncbi:hypothetical protein PVAND_004503 [Polypedilum vanderplanki]|uniref:Chemosensory protein n=1 Tax=Polypedilum vanderplanki TaxID=319348 RepID=A0A9J6BXE3_POLVA|nr:hypothetical protein PVAND_004503 [Polypedilum vanderplanki]